MSHHFSIRCHECGTTTSRTEVFHELDLPVKDLVELPQSMKQFVAHEQLTGDDQYECEVCQKKRDATRSLVLTKIPRVLNLQLLRFMFVHDVVIFCGMAFQSSTYFMCCSYDRKTSSKKKLCHSFRFPLELDMSQYLSESEADNGWRYDE